MKKFILLALAAALSVGGRSGSDGAGGAARRLNEIEDVVRLEGWAS